MLVARIGLRQKADQVRCRNAGELIESHAIHPQASLTRL